MLTDAYYLVLTVPLDIETTLGYLKFTKAKQLMALVNQQHGSSSQHDEVSKLKAE